MDTINLKLSVMIRLLLPLMIVLVAVPSLARAQTVSRTPSAQLTRDSLTQLLARLEQAATSKGYSSAIRERARQEAELIRLRLQQGDFQVGDRIYLKVERQAELTDTFTVSAGPALVLPQIRDVPLAGLLRGELEQHLQQHLKRFLVDPVVEATALMRVWIEGGVNQPGIYLMPSETVLVDAIMKAGGLSRDAKLSNIRIERGNRRIWEGEALHRAITEGNTLDQLSLQAGDRIVVGTSGPSRLGSVQMLIGVLVPLITLLVTRL